MEPGPPWPWLEGICHGFLNSGDKHAVFVHLLQNVRTLSKSTGSVEGCYLMMQVQTGTTEQLGELLEALLPLGNYRVSLSIGWRNHNTKGVSVDCIHKI